MATRSLQDQVSAVLGRTVAEAKSRGTPNVQVEVAALFESISLNLLLHPRAVLYFQLLARNGLLKVVNDEIAAIDSLTATIQDLGNPSFNITASNSLNRARTSLLQIESMDKISSSNSTFRRFDSAVDEALTDLAKNVRRSGSTSLTRPAAEARTALPGDFAALKKFHVELLDRLYALAVGLDNFLLAPLSTILGLTTAVRARLDIEQMLADLGSDDSSINARDIATRLLANRAALKSVGSAPSALLPVLTSTSPAGYTLRAASDPTPVVIQGVAGDYALPVGASLTVLTSSSTRTATNFPQTTFDLSNQAHVTSAVVAYPVAIPAGSSLFLTFTRSDGSTASYKVALSGSMTLSAVVAAINATVGADGGADEFVQPGTSRVLVWAKSPNTRVSIDTSFVDTSVDPPSHFAASAHSLLGLPAGSSAPAGLTPSSTLVDACTVLFGDLFSITPGWKITSVDQAAGAFLGFTGSAASNLYLAPMTFATSTSVRLYGVALGSLVDPFDPRSLVQVGDQLAAPFGVAAIAATSPARITLAAAIQTFDAPIVVTSSVVLAFQALNALLDSFLTTWTLSGYQVDLLKIDRAIAGLTGSAAAAQINAALSVLAELRALLVVLQGDLNDPSTQLPTGAAGEEKKITNGILASLEERKFDRARDLLLKGQIQEALNVDHDTASYAGNFMRRASDLAQNDFKYPNRSLGEGLSPNGARSGT